MEIHRYERHNVVTSQLNPFEDVLCWVEGLTSTTYVKELLKSRHSLQGPQTIRRRSEAVARLVHIACEYLEQAMRGPKEVSFLPLYYAFLNLSKAYIVIGPLWYELNQNRWHGASYDAQKDVKALNNEEIELHAGGAIPLLYRTLVGENIFQNISPPLKLQMRDVYPYISDVSAEYGMATGKKSRLIPFRTTVITGNEGKQMIKAEYAGKEKTEFDKVNISFLQGYRRLHKDAPGSASLSSQWYDKDDAASLMSCVRPAMLYCRCGFAEDFYQLVPLSRGKLLLPEELPLVLAFFHMSSVVRYNPDGLNRLMDSKYWPVLLVLQRQGAYRFLQLFWWYATQCCTYIQTP